MPQRLLTIALFIALSVYAWRGWYTRYWTDDFCTVVSLRKNGVLGNVQYHREVWGGRYSFYLAKSAFEAIGPITTRFTPALMLVLIGGAAYWSIRRLLSTSRSVTLLAAAAVAFAAVDASPDRFSAWGPFVWETGSVTYMLPVALLIAWLGLFASRGSIALCSIASALIAFIAGGFSETLLAAQGVLTAGLLVVALATKNTRAARISGAALIGTLLSLAVIATAPGNAIRLSTHPPQPELPTAMWMTLRLAYDFVGSHLFVDGESLLVVIVAGAFAGMCGARIAPRIAIAFAAIALSAYTVSLLPSAWILGEGPPPRALHIHTVLMIAALFVLAVSIGSRLTPKWATVLLLASLIIPFWSVWTTMQNIPGARHTAAQVDAIDAELRTQRGRDVVLRSRWALVNRFLVEEPTSWTNECVSEYYGLSSLSVVR